MIPRLLQFLGWPILAGAIAAVVLLVLFPELLKPSSERISDKSAWNGPVSYSDAVNRAAPSVVNIYSRRQIQRPHNPILDDPRIRSMVDAVSPRTRQYFGLGSGVILTGDGYIVTNLHVVSGADQIWVQLQDGRQAEATRVGSDKLTDLTILKIELGNLTPIPVGDSMAAKVGDVVLAIGNPHGVGQTVTQGIISATGQRDFGNNRFRDSIQTDAAINPGNSGGALVDAHGKLLGINSEVLNRSNSYGISFAIPSDTAIKVLNDIREYGYVIRGDIGISGSRLLSARSVQMLTSVDVEGILVESLNAGPASSAGVRTGDIIIGINGERRIDQAYIAQIMSRLAPGDIMTLEILRGSTLLEIKITAGIAPAVIQ